METCVPGAPKSQTAPAAPETLAVRRDPQTGRFTSKAAGNASPMTDDARTLGAETRFAIGNRAARRHGVRALETRGALDDDVREHLETFQAGVTADQGGASELTTIAGGYVRKLTHLEAICALLAADIDARGLFTQRGRVRSTHFALLKSVEQWDRLAQRLGHARKAKPVPSLEQWADQLAEVDAEPDPLDAASDAAGDTIAALIDTQADEPADRASEVAGPPLTRIVTDVVGRKGPTNDADAPRCNAEAVAPERTAKKAAE